jgi:hypothetical protein
MRLVFDHIDLHVVLRMQQILDRHGIFTRLQENDGTGMTGEIPHTRIYPELWLIKNPDAPRAHEIIRTHRDELTTPSAGTDWAGPKCGALVGGVLAEMSGLRCRDALSPLPQPHHLARLASSNRRTSPQFSIGGLSLARSSPVLIVPTIQSLLPHLP